MCVHADYIIITVIEIELNTFRVMFLLLFCWLVSSLHPSLCPTLPLAALSSVCVSPVVFVVPPVNTDRNLHANTIHQLKILKLNLWHQPLSCPLSLLLSVNMYIHIVLLLLFSLLSACSCCLTLKAYSGKWGWRGHVPLWLWQFLMQWMPHFNLINIVVVRYLNPNLGLNHSCCICRNPTVNQTFSCHKQPKMFCYF